jgi:hypothetical protein
MLIVYLFAARIFLTTVPRSLSYCCNRSDALRPRLPAPAAAIAGIQGPRQRDFYKRRGRTFTALSGVVLRRAGVFKYLIYPLGIY